MPLKQFSHHQTTRRSSWNCLFLEIVLFLFTKHYLENTQFLVLTSQCTLLFHGDLIHVYHSIRAPFDWRKSQDCHGSAWGWTWVVEDLGYVNKASLSVGNEVFYVALEIQSCKSRCIQAPISSKSRQRRLRSVASLLTFCGWLTRECGKRKTHSMLESVVKWKKQVVC